MYNPILQKHKKVITELTENIISRPNTNLIFFSKLSGSRIFTHNAKLTCNFCCERLCKMELRDIHKRAQQKLSGGAPCYARRPKPVTHTLGDR
jgi:hypothetical protein